MKKLIFILSITFSTITFVYSQIPDSLKMNFANSDAVSIDLVKRIAKAEALKRWEIAVIGEISPLVNSNGELIYYQVVLKIGGDAIFPNKNELQTEVENNCPKIKNGLRWDEEKYATFYIAASTKFLPIAKVVYGLPKHILEKSKFLKIAEEKLGSNATIKNIYFDGFECGYEFTNNNTSVILDTYTFSECNKNKFDFHKNIQTLEDELNDNNFNYKEIISNEWVKLLKSIQLPKKREVRKVDNWERIFRFDGACGCSPTAAATALSYYDNNEAGNPMNKNTSNGRLIDYYLLDQSVESYLGSDGLPFTSGNADDDTPNLLIELAMAMETRGGDGHTSIYNIASGIGTAVASNGYNCTYDHWGIGLNHWQDMKNEIFSNRTFTLGILNHTLCAYGFSEDPNLILVFDSNNETFEEPIINIITIDVFEISNEPYIGDIETLQPIGYIIKNPDSGYRDIYMPGNEMHIQWFQWEDQIDYVNILYTYDEFQNNFYTIASNHSSSIGINTISWVVPNINLTRDFRIYIAGYDNNNQLCAADGSSGNIVIDSTLQITPMAFDFGNVEPNSINSGQLILKKGNYMSYQDLKINILNPTGAFDLIEPINTFNLNGTQGLVISLQFSPGQPNTSYSATLQLISTYNNNVLITVPLSGNTSQTNEPNLVLLNNTVPTQVSSEGGNFSVTVQNSGAGTLNWSTENVPDWITINPPSGSTNNSQPVSIVIANNLTYSSRSANIKFYNQQNQSNYQYLSVFQQGISQPTTDWESFQKNAQNNGYINQTINTEIGFTWGVHTNENYNFIGFGPIIKDNKIIFACYEGVFCFDINGNQLWQNTTNNIEFTSYPTIYNNTIFVCGEKNSSLYLYALNAQNGSIIDQIACFVSDAPLVADNTGIYATTEQRWIYAYTFNNNSLSLKWKFDSEDYPDSFIGQLTFNGAGSTINSTGNYLYANGRAYDVFNNTNYDNGYYLIKINKQNGILEYVMNFTLFPNGSSAEFKACITPSIYNNRIFFEKKVNYSNQSKLLGKDISSGGSWEFNDFENDNITPPVAYNGKIYFADDDGYVYCLNANTGAQIFKKNRSNDIERGLAICNNALIGISENDKVFLLDLNNGDEINKINIPYEFRADDYSAPAIAGNKIIFGNSNGDIICISDEYPPEAFFTASPLNGIAPLSVQFDDESEPGSAPITNWLWDFGDGTISSSQNPNHIFQMPGLYSISLTVSTNHGSSVKIRNNYINVSSPEPLVANFTANINSGIAPLEIQFTDLSTGTPTTWEWDFENNGSIDSYNQNPVWTYNLPGVYSVKLRVANQTNESIEIKYNFIAVTPNPFINVTSPNGGEFWEVGSTHNITWNDNISENVKIELYKANQLNLIVNSSTSSNGAYTWDIPSNQQLAANYKIKITNVSDPSINDYSDNYFEIVLQEPSNITVTSPNGGEDWEAGLTHNITWSDNISENVKIELYKGSQLNSTIISSTPSDGSHSWTIPASQTPATNYKIKITSTSNSSINDFSDSYFEIYHTPDPFITVTSPNGGEDWQAGTTHNITWTDNISENVKIELYKGSQLNSTIISSTPSDGSYSWTIPANQEPADNYKIKITSTSNHTVYGFSGDFAIHPEQNIFIISPDGYGVWQAGNSYEIIWFTWLTDNISENVKIELHKGGVFDSTIISSTPNNESYTWSIPVNQQPDTIYKIKIISTADPNNYGISRNFEIYNYNFYNINVTSPNGGEDWEAGTTHNITWTDNISENVKIELFQGGTSSTIINSTPSVGDHSWIIPSNQQPATNYRIKITSTANPDIYDYSGYFEIHPEKNISILTPNGGEVWLNGAAQNITWSDNISEDVKIELYKGEAFDLTISSSTSSNGSYSWDIPSNQQPATTYKIKIASTSDPIINDYSDNYFEIDNPPFITVASPNGGEVWQAGTAHDITWTDNLSENVDIYLYKNDSFDHTIKSSISNNGSYQWHIPSTLQLDANYLIKISGVLNSHIFDFSDVFFEISQAPFLTVTPECITLEAYSGSWGLIEISSNISWVVSCTAGWIDLSSNNGIGNSNLKITANKSNNEGFVRGVTLSIDGENVATQNFVVKQLSASGISDSDSLKVFELWPNPVDEKLFIKSTCNQEINIFILNHFGQEVFSKLNVDKETAIDVSTFAPGLYFIKLTCKDETGIQKLIIR